MQRAPPGYPPYGAPHMYGPPPPHQFYGPPGQQPYYYPPGPPGPFGQQPGGPGGFGPPPPMGYGGPFGPPPPQPQPPPTSQTPSAPQPSSRADVADPPAQPAPIGPPKPAAAPAAPQAAAAAPAKPQPQVARPVAAAPAPSQPSAPMSNATAAALGAPAPAVPSATRPSEPAAPAVNGAKPNAWASGGSNAIRQPPAPKAAPAPAKAPAPAAPASAAAPSVDAVGDSLGQLNVGGNSTRRGGRGNRPQQPEASSASAPAPQQPQQRRAPSGPMQAPLPADDFDFSQSNALFVKETPAELEQSASPVYDKKVRSVRWASLTRAVELLRRHLDRSEGAHCGWTRRGRRRPALRSQQGARAQHGRVRSGNGAARAGRQPWASRAGRSERWRRGRPAARARWTQPSRRWPGSRPACRRCPSRARRSDPLIWSCLPESLLVHAAPLRAAAPLRSPALRVRFRSRGASPDALIDAIDLLAGIARVRRLGSRRAPSARADAAGFLSRPHAPAQCPLGRRHERRRAARHVERASTRCRSHGGLDRAQRGPVRAAR